MTDGQGLHTPITLLGGFQNQLLQARLSYNNIGNDNFVLSGKRKYKKSKKIKRKNKQILKK